MAAWCRGPRKRAQVSKYRVQDHVTVGVGGGNVRPDFQTSQTTDMAGQGHETGADRLRMARPLRLIGG